MFYLLASIFLLKGLFRMAKKLRICFVGFLILDIAVIGFMLVRSIRYDIPDQLVAYVGEKEEIELPEIFQADNLIETLSVKRSTNGFSMCSKKTGEYQVSVNLFGVVPIKNVDVKVIEKMKLAPSGEPIGIYVETKGLLVLDTIELEGRDGLTYAPGKNILKTGDYILKWNNVAVPTIKKLNRQIQQTGKKKVSVTIRRQNEEMKVALQPVLATDQTYKIGTWVREDTQGIGTLTYLTEDGNFGTLGHGISDADTGTLLALNNGELYSTQIMEIIKGNKGEPGELQGYIDMVANNEIGQIKKNTEVGVFGCMKTMRKSSYAKEFVSVGMKQDLKKGKAYIYANLEGKAKKYEIQIEEININSMDNKSFVIHVTDPHLLNITGGIVQGMSGSPILQNGKLVGAVTHVLVDDPTRGYGVFIENMLGVGYSDFSNGLDRSKK